MSKHTPTPWYVKETKTGFRVESPIPPNWIPAVPVTFVAECQRPSDAQLIAAAPDLLEALEACLESFTKAHAHARVGGRAAHSDGSILCACDKARAALKKVRGE